MAIDPRRLSVDKDGRVWRLCEYVGGPRDGEEEWTHARVWCTIGARDGAPALHQYETVGDCFVYRGEVPGWR